MNRRKMMKRAKRAAKESFLWAKEAGRVVMYKDCTYEPNSPEAREYEQSKDMALMWAHVADVCRKVAMESPKSDDA